MKIFCILILFISSGSVWAKKKRFLIGPGVWTSPEIGYDSIKAKGEDSAGGVEEEHKTTLGVSAEFVAPQPDGNFFGLGMDIFFQSKNKNNPDVKLAPISFFANFGIMEPYCVNLNARIFAGIGAMFLNYKSLHENADFAKSLGMNYQFGAGIITTKFFVDVLMRGGIGSLERTFSAMKSKADADYSFTSTMLKVGIVF